MFGLNKKALKKCSEPGSKTSSSQVYLGLYCSPVNKDDHHTTGGASGAPTHTKLSAKQLRAWERLKIDQADPVPQPTKTKNVRFAGQDCYVNNSHSFEGDEHTITESCAKRDEQELWSFLSLLVKTNHPLPTANLCVVCLTGVFPLPNTSSSK